MNQEQRDRVEELCVALESGKYTQFRGQLRGDDNERCCLGVACEVYMQHCGGNWECSHLEWSFLGESATLPKAVIEWFGFNNKNPTIKMEDRIMSRRAAALNDTGSTFKDIAWGFRKTFLTEQAPPDQPPPQT